MMDNIVHFTPKVGLCFLHSCASPKSDQIIRGRMRHFPQIAPRLYNHPLITNLNIFQDDIMRGSKDRQKRLKRNQIKGNNVWLLI